MNGVPYLIRTIRPINMEAWYWNLHKQDFIINNNVNSKKKPQCTYLEAPCKWGIYSVSVYMTDKQYGHSDTA